MNCSNCNAWIPDDAAFCPECGHKAEPAAPAAAAVFCGNCGAPMAADEMFCGNCGAKVESGAKPVKEKKQKTPGKGMPKKLLMLVAAVAVIAVLVLVVSMIGGGSKTDSYAVYVKSGEMQVAQLPKLKKPVELTSRLMDSSYDSNYTLRSMYVSYLVKLSSDGKTMFYPEKMEIYDGYVANEFTLYCRNVQKPKKDPVKIDSGIQDGYYINEAGTLVTYTKDGNLYQHDLKEKTKIDGDVTNYRVSKDGKTLIYLVWDYSDDCGDLYLKSGSKDAEKVASEVTHLYHVSEDLTQVIYMKDDTLYRMETGKEPEKISSEVISVLNSYDTGACYYTKQEDSELTYWDVINDDVNSSDYDYTRNWMKEETFTNPVKSLYYFDGKESVLITENLVEYYSSSYGTSTAMVAYTALEGELPKVKFSKYLEEYDSVPYLLEEAMEDECISYVALGAEAADTELEDLHNASISKDGKYVYVGAEYDYEDSSYSLYKLEISGGAVKNSQLLNDEVYTHRTFGDSSVLYWNDVNDDWEGEMYLDDKKVDDDVYYSNFVINEDNSSVCYMVDWNSNKSEGTLKVYNGKKAVEVKEDATRAAFTPDGDVLFLCDVSSNSYKGEVWKWNGKKATLVEEDVIQFFIVK